MWMKISGNQRAKVAGPAIRLITGLIMLGALPLFGAAPQLIVGGSNDERLPDAIYHLPIRIHPGSHSMTGYQYRLQISSPILRNTGLIEMSAAVPFLGMTAGTSSIKADTASVSVAGTRFFDRAIDPPAPHAAQNLVFHVNGNPGQTATITPASAYTAADFFSAQARETLALQVPLQFTIATPREESAKFNGPIFLRQGALYGVAIRIDSAMELTALQGALQFDPAVLRAVDVDGTSSTIANTFSANLTQSGTVQFAFSRQRGLAGLPTSESVALVLFEAIGATGSDTEIFLHINKALAGFPSFHRLNIPEQSVGVVISAGGELSQELAIPDSEHVQPGQSITIPVKMSWSSSSIPQVGRFHLQFDKQFMNVEEVRIKSGAPNFTHCTFTEAAQQLPGELRFVAQADAHSIEAATEEEVFEIAGTILDNTRPSGEVRLECEEIWVNDGMDEVVAGHPVADSQKTITKATRTLAVTSEYGTPVPSGNHVVTIGTSIAASVNSQVTLPDGVRHNCVGWIGTGAAPASGTINQTTFDLDTDSTLQWLWDTEYYLTVLLTPPGSGSVSPGSSWRDAGEVVSVTASPNNLHVFSHWTGAASGNQIPLNLTMDGAKTLTAVFTRKSGTVNITTTPATAPWSFVDGDGAVHNGVGPATLLNIPTGSIVLTWGALAKYDKPSPEAVTKSLSYNATINFAGTYKRQTGMVRVSATPNSGAWSFSDGDGLVHNGVGDDIVTGVPTGVIQLSWVPMPLYASPATPPTKVLSKGVMVTFGGTFTPNGLVTKVSRKDYELDILQPGKKLYCDEDWTFMPPVSNGLEGKVYLRTYNADRNLEGKSFLSFNIAHPCKVYVALSSETTQPPAWLASWQKLPQSLTSTCTPAGRHLYMKYFPAGKVLLGANRDASMPMDQPMYSVIIVRNTSADHWERYR